MVAMLRRANRAKKQKPNGAVLVVDPADSAEEAGLRYVGDDRPGYSRKANGNDFEYFDTEGKRIRDEQRLLRIKRLAVPPAWTHVWICPSPNGHLQASGRDARRRKQYRYHERWREIRDENKFARLADFAKALPKIRRRITRDMEGLLKEGEEMIKEDAEEEVRDAGLIAAAQRVEHYEMAGYGCARTYAELLGDKDGAQLLQTTLTEESDTDKKLTQLAKSAINVAAQ